MNGGYHMRSQKSMCTSWMRWPEQARKLAYKYYGRMFVIRLT